MKHSSPQEISPDELIRQKVVSPPDPIDPRHFPLPPEEKITVLPPIIDNENDSSSVIERLLTNPSTVAGQVRKQRRFCGIPVPLKYADYSAFALFGVWFRSKRSLGTFISLLVHIVLFLILATIVITVQSGTLGRLNVEMAPEMGDLLSVDLAGDAIETEKNTFDAQKPRELEQTPLSHWELDHPTEDFWQSLDVGSITTPAEKVIDTESGSGGIPILQQNGSTSSRTEENRIKGIPGREGDTTKESEDAVERGLSWLAAHQWPDGSWAFDLNSQDRTGQTIFCDCINSKQNIKHHESYRGELHPSRTAATALALLPFLGAGYTHQKENKYRQVVNAGLDFLKYQLVETDAGFDFRSDWAGQGMYIQGITTLTLCEAYEMTGDESLRSYAQGAIRFIESAQRDDGGWRYHIPTENQEFYKDATGDTTITGWQMMALKSAISAGLDVQPSTLYRVSDFLELVQVKDGSQYKYIPSTNETEDKLWSTTAVGLLIRLYLGWNRQYPAFRKGIDYLTQWLQESNRDWLDVQNGKTSNKRKMLIDPANQALIHNLYFSYYAILVLHLSDSSEWHPSFAKMREFLIQTQSRGLPGDLLKGHSESGSWLFSDIYLNDGGRLLYTVLALLILETPYRYLPMYSEQKSLP
ncbi:MAG: hypothetical protein Q4C95_06230 [Planctomycetia bacterium]|nr:hypothetical protein [Planctomycetia bacterium]